MFKKLINISGNSAFSSHLDSGLDNRLFYSFNTKLSSILEADLCLLLGLNLRIAAPLLNAKIRQAYIKKSLPIYVIGYFSNFTYYCKHVSTNYKSVLQILEGSH
jgi:NADH dehydrogenase/NADH:ubiquinone oxidoreductase subunit G